MVLLGGCVAFAAMILAEALPGSAAPAYSVAWTAGAVCAASGMLAARTQANGQARALWTWLAAAALSWLAGQLAWDVFEVFGAPTSPNLADFGWWGFAALTIAGLLRT